MTELNTHGVTLTFGKHRGELVTRVPVSYLIWMVNNGTQMADIALAELGRRGTTIPDIEISGHAVDSASHRILDLWQARENKDEGLHAWLCRMAKEAKEHGALKGEKLCYAGIKFVIEDMHHHPVVKTVMRDKSAKKAA